MKAHSLSLTSLIPPFSNRVRQSAAVAQGEGIPTASLFQAIKKFSIYIGFALQRNQARTPLSLWRGGGGEALLAALLLCGAERIDAQVIAGGGNHSLFRCSSGAVMTCGYNSDGQLGDSTNTTRNFPIQVSGLYGITAIAGGWDYSLFLKNDGSVRACGSNGNGQLGDGTGANKNFPVQVSGLTGIIAVAAGYYHSLFLKNDGTVWACGRDDYGQLGVGTTTQRNSPVQVSGLTGITAVAAGETHSLFLKNNGTVWVCGRNDYGQLGDGTNTDRNLPVQVSGISGITAITAGYYHSLFLKNDGTVWACGWNRNGQLGNGTTIDRNLPVQVSGITGITAFAGGWEHSLFLKNDGTVWVCGWNMYGQLGDGTTTQRKSPVQVQNLCMVLTPTHQLTGNLFDDANNNCTMQSNEKGFSSVAVAATPGNLYAFSNDTGYFSLGVYDSVNYTVLPLISQRLAHLLKSPCPANYSVQLSANDPVDTSGFDFGFDANFCYQLRVAVGEDRKRRCARNTMSVYYWNEGIAAASNVALHVKFSKYDIPVSASLLFTRDTSDNSIVFNLGTLNANQFGSISIVDSIACVNGITALTQCTRAWILPVNQCYIDSTQGTGWDKSETKVTGGCVNDSLVCFKIENRSSPPGGNMQGTAPWRLYINDTLVNARRLPACRTRQPDTMLSRQRQDLPPRS